MKRRMWMQAALAMGLMPGMARATLNGPNGLPDAADVAAAAGPGARTLADATAGRRLVLVELAGANDGLNTLVPVSNDHYRSLRPSLALSVRESLSLGEATGEPMALHKALRPLMPLVERSELTLVQGLGYPAPNRSHFRSIALWETGGDGQQGEGHDGWITHDLEHRLAVPRQDPEGISLEGGLGVFHSGSGTWMSARSAEQLLSLQAPSAATDESALATMPAAFERMARKMRSLEVALHQLQSRLADVPEVPKFDGGHLAEQLHQVARFIAAGLDTPVFRVQLSGFDTHENQSWRHADLLDQLGWSLAGFRDSLVAMGEWDQTLVVSYSEFGRRVAENRSGGTDHGTAAPHFVAGGQLARHSVPVLLGRAPDLGNLIDGDPPATMDYRALYDRILAGWFGIEQNRFASWRDESLKQTLRT